jgi:uncharacterized RDD family membrane protein YckC
MRRSNRADPSDTAINIFWGCAGSIFPAWLLYFFIALTWKGQTIGQSVMQVMVIRSDGQPLGVWGAVARVIGLLAYVVFVGAGIVAGFALKDSAGLAAGAIALGIALCVAGVFWAAFDGRRRTLHDRLAGTIVVRVE